MTVTYLVDDQPVDLATFTAAYVERGKAAEFEDALAVAGHQESPPQSA